MPRVYLAGPISGLKARDAIGGWRSRAADYLPDHWVLMNPMRGKEDFLAPEDVLGPLQCDQHEPIGSPKGIVGRDFNDVGRADAVLACFLDGVEGKVSVGTCVELGVAYALGVPVVVVLEPRSVHDHPFVTERAVYVYRDLYSACHALELMLR